MKFGKDGLGWHERDDDSALKEVSEIAGGKVRRNFAERLRSVANGNLLFRNTVASGTVLREVILDAGFSCTFVWLKNLAMETSSI